MSQLSARKQALLERLLKGQPTTDPKGPGIPKRDVHSPVPLSFAQQRLWVLDQLVPGNPFYNLPTAFQISGRLDVALFEACINELIRRHESLRTVFTTAAEEPVQVILPELTISVDTVDLRALPAAGQRRETIRLTGLEASRPFDLSRGPLLRVSLLELSQDAAVLLFTMHHIVSDAWSVEVFIRELATLYSARALGRPSPLPDSPLQYADFAIWQRQRMKGEVVEKQLAYWREILSGELPILELPTDFLRPAVPSYRGGYLDLRLPQALTAKLTALCRQEQCSLFMALLAILYTLLYRCSGQDDILVGSPIANRTRPELENMIGFFANTLVFRIRAQGSPTFRQLLSGVRRLTSTAYDNQDLPFEKLVEAFQPDRYMSHTPFFQVMFNYKATGGEKRTGGDSPSLSITPFPVHNKTSKFDLWFTLHPRAGRLEGGVEYNTDVFAGATVSRMIRHFRTLAAHIAADPDRPIARLPLLSKSERTQILVQWNDTRRAYEVLCLSAAFDNQVERSGTQTALVGPRAGGDASPLHLAYRELHRQAAGLARRLHELGVTADMPVAIFLERSLEMVIGLLGILEAGGAYLPLDPEYPGERISYMLNDSGARIVLTADAHQSSLSFNNHTPVPVDDLPDTAANAVIRGKEYSPAEGLSPANLAYIIYTSGSTGKPKGVAIAHEAIINRLHWMQETYRLTPDDRVLQKTPFSFDVSVWEFFWPLLNGAGLVVARAGGHKDSAYLVETIVREKVTTIHFVPAMLNVFLEDPGLPQIVSLRRVICSGEALPPEYRQRFFACFGDGVELHNLYGPTEAAVDVTAWQCRSRRDHRSVPIGRPVANTRIYILDSRGQPVPIGVHGEIHIGGIQLARGYLNNPELTAHKFINLNLAAKSREGTRSPQNTKSQILTPKSQILYRTGDLARFLPTGEIEFLGRLDFQVKVRGFRIELGEIESNLREHQAVQDAVVLARDQGQSLVGYITLDHGYLEPRGQAAGSDPGEEQVSDWQGVFDDTYRQDPGEADPTFNIVGWNSSYTGSPISTAEMRQWVEHTVARILSLKPGRILEIGCGTGLFLFRLIPYCDYYLGTDIAARGLAYIGRQLEKIREPGWAEVELGTRSADNFDGIEREAFDLVILNSVVQYFPSPDYLVRVVRAAAAALKPGGHIFIGDVRSLPLFKTFHASVAFHQAEPGASREQVVGRAMKQMALDQELVIRPDLFLALGQQVPELGPAELLLKYGDYVNELSKFRYDVILPRADGSCPQHEAPCLDWSSRRLDLAALRTLLSRERPACLAVTDVPNSRLAADIRLEAWLNRGDGPATKADYLAGRTGARDMNLDPGAFRALEQELPYRVAVGPAASGDPAGCDVVFRHRDLLADHVRVTLPPRGPAVPERASWADYTNNPLLVKLSGRIVPELRRFLKERVPEYMVPGSFVLLERLPLTPSGKLDRRSLPEPLRLDLEGGGEPVEPDTPQERLLADIWCRVLNIEKVGVQHNFFELGGDSVKAIQVVSRANKQGLALTVQHLYRNQNIADLARLAGTLEAKERIGPPGLGEQDVRLEKDLERVRQYLPAGLEIEDVWPVTPQQRHMLDLLDRQQEPDPGLFQIHKLYLPQTAGIDPRVFAEVLAQVTAHRPLLRSLFVRDGLPEPVQVIAKQGETPLIYEDWSGLPPGEQRQKLKELISTEWRRGMDRARPTALRMVLLKLAADTFQYFFTSDYVRFDGWSSTIIQNEILNCYVSRDMGLDLQLKEENLYKYYLTALEKQDMDAAEGYWRGVLGAGRPATSFVPRFPGNVPHQGRGFARQHVYMSADTTVNIDRFLQKNRLVHSILVYAVWALLLARYADDRDVVFGVIFSGRSIAWAGLESMVGNSINVLPVRLKIRPGQTVLHWLKEIFADQAEANRYEYTPLRNIKAWWGADPDEPLFDSYIVMQNLPAPNFEEIIENRQFVEMLKQGGQDRKVKGVGEIPDNRKHYQLFYAEMEYPLRVDVYMPSQLCLVFNYFRRHLLDSVVKGYMENMVVLLESIIADPMQTVGRLMARIDPHKYPQPQNYDDVDVV